MNTESCMVQNQYTKSVVYIHQQWTSKKRN